MKSSPTSIILSLICCSYGVRGLTQTQPSALRRNSITRAPNGSEIVSLLSQTKPSLLKKRHGHFEVYNSSRHHRSEESSDSSKTISLKIAACYLLACIIAAQNNMMGPYSGALIARDIGSTFLAIILSFIFVNTTTKLATDGVLLPRDSRKVIHLLSAPLFMFLWPLFSDAWGARMFAACPTILQIIRLWIAGKSNNNNDRDGQELVGAISRSGNSSEALGGPFIYVVILLITMLLFWRDNLSSIMILSTMAAGDGLADIVGRRLGKNNKWFFSEDKSIAGSLAFVLSSCFCALSLAYWFQYTGTLNLSLSFDELARKVLQISVLSALTELLPIGDDNWNVPLAAGVLSQMLLTHTDAI